MKYYKINGKISIIARIILQQYDITIDYITKLCGLKHYTILTYDKFWESHREIFSNSYIPAIYVPISIPIPIPQIHQIGNIITPETVRLLSEREDYKNYRDTFNSMQCGYKSRYCKD